MLFHAKESRDKHKTDEQLALKLCYGLDLCRIDLLLEGGHDQAHKMFVFSCLCLFFQAYGGKKVSFPREEQGIDIP